MNDPSSALAIALFSELLTADQLVRNRLSKVLPKGMEISHFSVLNHLARATEERSPLRCPSKVCSYPSHKTLVQETTHSVRKV